MVVLKTITPDKLITKSVLFLLFLLLNKKQPQKPNFKQISDLVTKSISVFSVSHVLDQGMLNSRNFNKGILFLPFAL